MNGIIVTFYSYKGGVGRSFLLANVAVLLARWGYRVLCVDWDIEAPGLDEYFRPWLRSPERKGLVDLATEVDTGHHPDWRAHVSELTLPGIERSIGLITAGAPGPSLPARIQAIDWRSLYDHRDFGAYVEAMRADWKTTYDFVLIDSRTGITDIGGICTVHLPDILVVVFTANQQSLGGVKDVTEMAELQRSKLPLNRAGLLTLPVPARFDGRGRDDLAKDWLRRIAEQLDRVYDNWLDVDVSPRQFLDVSRIPYFSIWSFGERLAVLEERENDPESISYYFATIAALLARRLGDSGQLYRNRDGYVAVARSGGQRASSGPSTSKFQYDYYLSYAKRHLELAGQIAAELRSRGLRVLTNSDEVSSIQVLMEAFEEAMQQCQHLIVLRDISPLSRWQRYEIESFGDSGIDDTRQLYDVQLSPAAPELAQLISGNTPLRSHKIDASRPSPSKIVEDVLPSHPSRDLDTSISDELYILADRYVAIDAHGVIEVRFGDLFTEGVQAPFDGDYRIDALVCTRAVGVSRGYRTWTQAYRVVDANGRLPVDNGRLFRGPVRDFVDIALFLSRNAPESADLEQLLASRETSPDFLDAAQALLVPASGDHAPWVASVGGSMALTRIAHEALLAIAGTSIGLYRTSFLRQESFGAGRHPGEALYRASGIAFSLNIRPV
jgi:hypothetical protein